MKLASPAAEYLKKTMSIRSNIIANYASQIYVTLIGILLIPLYVKYLGAEAYGLVGFFAMLQAWFNLLDLGLSPTINRQTAQYHGGAISALEYRRLVRSLSLIFNGIAALGALILLMLSQTIATKWLNIEGIPKTEVILCIQIMSVSIGLRWIGGLYRGIISGSEDLVWLSFFTIIISTLKFIFVIPAMWAYGKTPTVFFLYQLTIAVIETTVLYLRNKKLLPKIKNSIKIGWSLSPIKPHLKFALSVALTSSLWVTVTQTDKLILSGTLSLKEYGFFTLAALIAGSIMMLSGPVSNALIPRLARLNAENSESILISTYRSATRLITIPASIITLTFAFFSKEILLIWSGSIEISENSSAILVGYAIGNGIMIISSLPTHLQVAKGDLKIHMAGSIIFSLLLLPTTIFTSLKFGAIGAAYTWLFVNLIYFILLPPIIHKRFYNDLHTQWLINDVLKPLTFSTLIFTTIMIFFELAQYQFSGKIFTTAKIVITPAITMAAIFFQTKKQYKIF